MGLSCDMVINACFIGHSYNYLFYLIIDCADNHIRRKTKHQTIYCFCNEQVYKGLGYMYYTTYLVCQIYNLGYMYCFGVSVLCLVFYLGLFG